jgi:hydroxyacylglutathione hydrolase
MGRPVIDFTSLAFQKADYGNGIYGFTAPMKEQIYLVLGEKQAMVIDNGMGIGSVLSEIRKVTSLPLVMVATHGHPDHAGGNAEFDQCYLNMKDLPVYREMVTKEFRTGDVHRLFGDKGEFFIAHMLPYVERLLPYQDGSVFDLGGRKLTAYEVSGHTLGSMVLFDENTNTLFAGDSLTRYETWLYLSYSTTMEVYYHSLLHLASRKLPLKRLLCGHLPNDNEPALLEHKIALAKDILDGKLVGKPFVTFAGKGLLAEAYDTSIVYDPNRLR